MSKNRALLLFTCIFIVSVVPFLCCVNNGFTNLDDYTYRFKEQIESGLSLQTFAWGFTFCEDGIWMPLTWCSYALDVSLFGGTPGGMHLHNVILHGLSCGLLFLMLSSLITQKGWIRNYLPALLAAMFWGVHPLRVEPVVWIASRKDVLSLFFELIALLLWVRHLNSGDGQSRKKYWLSFLFFVLATMAKPSAMTFPVIALILDVFVVRADKEEKWNWKQYVPLFIYGVIIAILAQKAQAASGATSAVGAPLWWRLLNAVASYGVYLFHTVWPSGLAVQCVCQWPDLPRHLLTGVVCVAAVGTFILAGICRHRKRLCEFKRIDDWPLAGFLMFTLIVGPVLGIASFGYHAYSDRFTYVPALGFCIVLTGLIRKLNYQCLIAVCCCATIVIGLLSVLTWRQCGFWENDEKLFRRTIKIDGDRYGVCHRALAAYYFEINHNPENVIVEFEEADRLKDEAVRHISHFYIISLFELGQTNKALEAMRVSQRKILGYFEKERQDYNLEKTRIPTGFWVACAAEAIAIGEYETAIDHFSKLEKKIPNYSFCNYLEGVMLLKQGNPEKALEAWRKIKVNCLEPFSQFRWLTEKLPADDAEALKMLPTLAWKEQNSHMSH